MTGRDRSEGERSHVGPIIFANEYARRQLLDHGEVVTFRDDRTTGKTWWTDEYGTAKNGDVHVEEIKAITPSIDTLDPYQPESGFPTTHAWFAAIDELHGSTTERGYLYRVTGRDPDE